MSTVTQGNRIRPGTAVPNTAIVSTSLGSTSTTGLHNLVCCSLMALTQNGCTTNLLPTNSGHNTCIKTHQHHGNPPTGSTLTSHSLSLTTPPPLPQYSLPPPTNPSSDPPSTTTTSTLTHHLLPPPHQSPNTSSKIHPSAQHATSESSTATKPLPPHTSLTHTLQKHARSSEG